MSSHFYYVLSHHPLSYSFQTICYSGQIISLIHPINPLSSHSVLSYFFIMISSYLTISTVLSSTDLRYLALMTFSISPSITILPGFSGFHSALRICYIMSAISSIHSAIPSVLCSSFAVQYTFHGIMMLSDHLSQMISCNFIVIPLMLHSEPFHALRYLITIKNSFAIP